MSKNRERGRISGQWAASRYEVLDSPAWKAMSFGARALYIALVRELSYSRLNNGNVFLSTRDAAEQLGTRQVNIGPWYQELEHYGFVVMTSPSCLGVEGRGRAARWRLTDWTYGPGCERTREYLKWDGTLFDKKISRSARPLQGEAHVRFIQVKRTSASGPPKSEAHVRFIQTAEPEAHVRFISRSTIPPSQKGSGPGRPSGRARKPPRLAAERAEPEVIDLPDFLPRRGIPQRRRPMTFTPRQGRTTPQRRKCQKC
jgi:hypothetical protein